MRTFTKKPKANQQTTSAKSSKPIRSFVAQSRDVHSILHLQRTIGNQAILRLLQTVKENENVEASPASSALTGFSHDFSKIPLQTTALRNIQPKLKVNAPRDRFEKEADRIADHLTKRDIPGEKQEHKIDIQAMPSLQDVDSNNEIGKAFENRLNRHKGDGNPLSPEVRGYFEPRFMHDFSKVRVHTDNEATLMNRDLGARAFTHGQNIYFHRGQYKPQSTEGTKLLAHELTHTVQQNQHISNANHPLVQRAIPTSAGQSGVSETRLAELHELMREYRSLRRSGSLSEEEIGEVSAAISSAESAIREAERVASAGSTMRAGAGIALGATAVLVADDMTGIGVADDVAIPFTLLAAGVLAVGAAIVASSTLEIQCSQQSARDAVTEVIRAIGQILLAQRVGRQVSGHTNQIAIHLARILGTAVAGRPPDHQEDPERDRPHWWTEIMTYIQQIRRTGLSPRQLLRELRRRFSEEQLTQIREALREAAHRLGEDPPNFPPAIP